MLHSQHVFSHQHQYPQGEPSWLHQSQHQQPQHTQQHHAHQAHAQAAAAAAAAASAASAQQIHQHYNRIAVNGNSNNSVGSIPSGLVEHAQQGALMQDGVTDENRRVLVWIAELMNPNSREAALLELSKKREQVPELALILWHSFGKLSNSSHLPLAGRGRPATDSRAQHLGVMTSLLQEIISVYPLLNPSQLTAAASNRVCNALALLQCVASHNDTRALFLSGMLALYYVMYILWGVLVLTMTM
jgi:CCR4-NOT transcription complex subunit 9